MGIKKEIVKIGTQSVELYNIEPLKKQTQDEIQQAERDILKLHDFYRLKFKKQNEIDVFDGVRIHRVKYLEKLMQMGYYVYHVDIDVKKFVRARNNVLKPIDKDYIIDNFIRYVRALPTRELADGTKITPEYLYDHCIAALDLLGKDILLRRLTPPAPFVIKDDTFGSKFFFYKNGFISVSKQGPVFMDYDQLDRFIWRDGVLNRDYQAADKRKSVIEQFIERICGHLDAQERPASYNEAHVKQRIKSLKTIIGYLLHNYTRGKRHAVIFTDAQMGDDGEANGRTGKSLFCKMLSWILNTEEKSTVYCEIPGRKFDVRDKHKYDKCDLDTRLVHLNDLYNHFNIEYLFNDITEGIEAKKLYEKPFTIQAKMVISTNKTIKIEGESAKARVVQFEFSDFFNDDRSPDVYYGHWFGDAWDAQEWARFDKFIFGCCKLYFNEGLIRAQEINLFRRAIIDHTDRDFVRWIEYKLSEKDDEGRTILDEDRIKLNRPNTPGENSYNKRDLYRRFLEDYPDFEKKKYFDQKRFTKWIKFYMRTLYPGINIVEKRSNSQDYIEFNLTE